MASTRNNNKKNKKQDENQATKNLLYCEEWPALSPQKYIDKSDE